MDCPCLCAPFHLTPFGPRDPAARRGETACGAPHTVPVSCREVRCRWVRGTAPLTPLCAWHDFPAQRAKAERGDEGLRRQGAARPPLASSGNLPSPGRSSSGANSGKCRGSLRSPALTGTALTCTALTCAAPAVLCRCGVRAACTVPHTVPVSYREALVCKGGGRVARPPDHSEGPDEQLPTFVHGL